eukprot:TRINITY_DN1326_c0_g3_i1.p1 TRINITY_DN1326_c0_g3~~TRINITY_DN1326_c0_g3_i1.p1  ORF type:complete len:196 (+),score=32.94 TRINITY_DN1326_c0_g3_i1:53-589(+)
MPVIIDVISEVLGSLTSKASASCASPGTSTCSSSECYSELSSSSWGSTTSSIYEGTSEHRISIREYIKRWSKYAHNEEQILLIAMIYLDRCCVKTKMTVTPANVHRLLLACLLVASKWFHDTPYSNKHYAAVGGVSLKDLNRLEVAILKDMRFSTHIEKKQLNVYAKEFSRPRHHSRR